jgi:hypothetical protein
VVSFFPCLIYSWVKKKLLVPTDRKPGWLQSQFGCSGGEKLLLLPQNETRFPSHPANSLKYPSSLVHEHSFTLRTQYFMLHVKLSDAKLG